MNKKIWSFVLATVLSVSLGSSSVFGYSYSEYSNEFSSQYSGKKNTKSVKVAVASASDLLGGNVTAVFQYYGGTIIGQQQAGGQFTLIDSYGARFTVDNKGGAWNVNGVNFRTSDLADMARLGIDINNINDGDVERFLKNFGFSDSAISMAKSTLVEDKYDSTASLMSIGYSKEEAEEIANEYRKAKNANDEEAKKAVMTKIENKLKESIKDDDSDAVKESKQKAIKASKESIMDTLEHKDGEVVIDDSTGEPRMIRRFVDENGEAITGKDAVNQAAKTNIPKEWLKTLVSHLTKGVNFSASAAVGSAITGPSLTLNENGKTMTVLQYDPDLNGVGKEGGMRQTTVYKYDDSGFMVGVQEATFELDSSENGNATLHWTNNFTHITYDSNGVRTETKYQFESFSNDPIALVANAQTLKPEDYKANNNQVPLSSSNPAWAVSVTKYSANNSRISMTDFTTNNTSYFANNMVSFTANAQGTTVEVYHYSENGIIEYKFDANGTDKEGNKVGTVTVFDQWGRQMFTAVSGLEATKDVSGENVKEAGTIEERMRCLKDNGVEKLKTEYYIGIQSGIFEGAEPDEDSLTEGTEVKVKEGTGTNISNIYVYPDQLLNKRNSAIMTNGFIDINKVNNVIANGGLNSVLIWKVGSDADKNPFGFSLDAILNMLKFSNGTNTAISSIQITPGMWTDEDEPIKKSSVDGKQGTPKTIVNETIKGKDRSKSMDTHSWHKTVDKEYDNLTKKGSKYFGTTYNVTVLLGGAQFYSFSHTVVTDQVDVYKITEHAIVETDPAVKGEMATKEEIEEMGLNPENVEKIEDGFVTMKDGTIYAVVKADEVNVMDGKGFIKLEEGETILVAVDGDTKDAIQKNMSESNDRSIMFMGNIRASVTNTNESNKPYLAMTMDKTYNGGFVQDDTAIRDEMVKIETLSNITISAANELGIDMTKFAGMSAKEIEKTDEYKAICEKAGVSEDDGWAVANTMANNGTFKSAGYTEGKHDGNIRDAWNLLLNF